ncbi:MAG TPA: cupin domain-containing protein, partial [Nitrospirales bacterium]|nr:cupin domain-containing protein [Nitrospirales bacterium]
LGPNLGTREVLAFTAPGGSWKCSYIAENAEFSLISEVVSLGFDFSDHEMATEELFAAKFPEYFDRLRQYLRT